MALLVHDLLQRTAEAFEALEEPTRRSAEERQAPLSRPAGPPGVPEAASDRPAGIQAACPARPLTRRAVYAGDHGVHRQGVSGWPQAVTGAMVSTMRTPGAAAVNVLGHGAGADVGVVDMGVVDEREHDGSLPSRRVATCAVLEAAAPRGTATSAGVVGK